MGADSLGNYPTGHIRAYSLFLDGEDRVGFFFTASSVGQDDPWYRRWEERRFFWPRFLPPPLYLVIFAAIWVLSGLYVYGVFSVRTWFLDALVILAVSIPIIMLFFTRNPVHQETIRGSFNAECTQPKAVTRVMNMVLHEGSEDSIKLRNLIVSVLNGEPHQSEQVRALSEFLSRHGSPCAVFNVQENKE